MNQALSTLKIIFHHPRTITSQGKSGSQVRPYEMLRAFRNLGIQVTEVTGNIKARKGAIKNIKHRIGKGETFDFLYSENLTVPFAMSEQHRLPTHPFLDHDFLSFCNAKQIPVGLFYRDIYWRDQSYKKTTPWWVRFITIPLYYYDWMRVNTYVNVLFIPSWSMSDRLPNMVRFKPIIHALPPASNPRPQLKRSADSITTVNLIYVGGIEPPIYDLAPLLACVSNCKNIRLTICCRKTEWKKFKSHYIPLLSNNVDIVHKFGEGLSQLYQKSDIQALIRNPVPYLDFAVPVKVFESISYGIPLLTTPGTEAARIIEREGFGWVKEIDQIPAFLDSLCETPSIIAEKKVQVETVKHRHSWEARAKEICNKMLDLSDGSKPS